MGQQQKLYSKIRERLLLSAKRSLGVWPGQRLSPAKSGHRPGRSEILIGERHRSASLSFGMSLDKTQSKWVYVTRVSEIGVYTCDISAMKKIVNLLKKQKTKDCDQPSKPVSVVEIVMPDIYGDEPTVPNLPTIDLRASGSPEPEDYDPYETAKLRVK